MYRCIEVIVWIVCKVFDTPWGGEETSACLPWQKEPLLLTPGRCRNLPSPENILPHLVENEGDSQKV